MTGRIKIHGALNFVGSGAELQNLEIEELTQDPTGLNPEDLGRMWLNVTEKRIKCVIELDGENRPVIETLPRNTDIVALQTLLSAKADKGTTLSSYGITDAVPTNVLNILAGNVAVMSGSNTTIPYDNTIPLVTEGALVMQATVNPRGTDSRFAFNFNSMGDASTDGLGIILALFRKIGSGAWNCVGITPFWIGNAVWLSTPSKPITLSMMHVDAPATIEPVSYMLRIGLTSSGSWYLGRGQDATFGGVGHSNYTITEFKQ